MTLTGGVDSMLGIESKNFINSPLVRPDFDGTLHRLSTSEYLQMYHYIFIISQL